MEESEDWWNFECNSHKKMEEFVDRCFFFATAAPEIIKVDPDSVFFPSWGLRHILTPQSGSRVCELPVLLKRLKFKVTWYMRLFFFFVGSAWHKLTKYYEVSESESRFTCWIYPLWLQPVAQNGWNKSLEDAHRFLAEKIWKELLVLIHEGTSTWELLSSSSSSSSSTWKRL